MAFRLMTVAIRKRAPLLSAPRILTPAVPSPIVRTYFERKNLTPFWDGTTFSKKAIAHHWGAVPIIVISLLAFTTEVIFWILIALTRHDVEFTRNSAHWKALETRQGVYYPAEYRKFIRFHQECKTPKDLIRANQGDTAGPDFAEDSDGKKKKSGEETEFSGKKLAGHAVLTGAALGLAAAL